MSLPKYWELPCNVQPRKVLTTAAHVDSWVIVTPICASVLMSLYQVGCLTSIHLLTDCMGRGGECLYRQADTRRPVARHWCLGEQDLRHATFC